MLETIADDALAEARLQILLEAEQGPKPGIIQATWDQIETHPLLLGLGCYDEDNDDEQQAGLKAALEVSIPPGSSTLAVPASF